MSKSGEASISEGDPVEHVRNATQAAAAGARQAATDLHEASKEARDDLSRGAKQAAADLREASKEAGEDLGKAATAAQQSAHDLWDRAGEAIRKHPMEAAGIAFAAGFVLSRLMRN